MFREKKKVYRPEIRIYIKKGRALKKECEGKVDIFFLF